MREIVEVRGPMERGRAVALRRVHVDALLQQRPHRLGVPVLDRVDQRRSPPRPRRVTLDDQRHNRTITDLSLISLRAHATCSADL